MKGEFIQQRVSETETVFILESASSGATSAGDIASATQSLFTVRRVPIEEAPPYPDQDDLIRDFLVSNAPSLRGKPQWKRIQMAVAAYYDKRGRYLQRNPGADKRPKLKRGSVDKLAQRMAALNPNGTVPTIKPQKTNKR